MFVALFDGNNFITDIFSRQFIEEEKRKIIDRRKAKNGGNRGDLNLEGGFGARTRKISTARGKVTRAPTVIWKMHRLTSWTVFFSFLTSDMSKFPEMNTIWTLWSCATLLTDPGPIP